MAEEKKSNNTEKEKDKSEKLIYILTGLLVVVIFGAIAVLYFNPSTTEKVYKPEKIQIAADMKKQVKIEEKAEGGKEELNNKSETTETTSQDNKQEGQVVQSENQTAEVKEKTKETAVEKHVEQKAETNEKVSQETKKKTDTNVVPQTKEEKQKTVITKKEEVKKEAKKEVKKTEKNVAEKKSPVKTVKKVENKREVKKVVKKYYYIQISALASMEKARKVKSQWEKKGFKNVIIIKEKGLYKVLIGRFNSMKEAFKFLREHNIKGGWVRVLKNPQ